MLRTMYYSLLISPLGFLLLAIWGGAIEMDRINHRGDKGPWIIIGIALYAFCVPFGMERVFMQRIADAMRDKGKDPEELLLQLGAALLVMPSTGGPPFRVG